MEHLSPDQKTAYHLLHLFASNGGGAQARGLAKDAFDWIKAFEEPSHPELPLEDTNGQA